MGGDRPQAVPVAALTLLAAGLRLVHLGTSPLWTDEAFSLWMARHPWAGIWTWTARLDAHPPLYYLLLHVWLGLGDGVVTLRSLSVIAGAATVPVAYLLGRGIGGAALGRVTALLLAVSPFNVWYGQEARMYPFLMLAASVALVGLVFVLRDTSRPSGWILYVAGITAALWIDHAAALLFITANVIVMALRRPLNLGSTFARRWVAAQGVIVIAWGPVVVMLLHQLAAGAAGPTSLNAWGAAASLLPDVFSPLFGVRPRPSTGARLGVTALALAVTASLIVRSLSTWPRDRRWITFLMVVWMLPIGCAVLLGVAGLSLLTPATLTAGYRTLIWTSLVPYLLLAQGLLSLRDRGTRIGAWGLLLTSCAASLIIYYRTVPKWEAWDRASAYVAHHLTAGDVIFFDDNIVQLPFDYYFRQYGTNAIEHGVPGDFPHDSVREPQTVPSDVVGVRMLIRSHPRTWLIYSHEWWTDRQHLVLEALTDTERAVDEQTFPGLPTIRVYLFQARARHP